MPTMTNGLKQTWTDLNTGAGVLRSVLIFGMSVGLSMLMMFLVCLILLFVPMLLVPITIVLSIALMALPKYGAKLLDCLAETVIQFKFIKELITKTMPNVVLIELSVIIGSIIPATPFTPPRFIA